MPCDSEYFIRELDITSQQDLVHTLELHQKSVGDVNCIVWDASMVLAKYLETQHSKRPNCYFNLNVIELGSGVGCVGLTAALLGANATLTDLPEALQIMTDNIAFNKNTLSKSQGSASAKILNWNDPGDMCSTDYQLILLSDCVYYTESIKPLIETMKTLCGERSEIIQCQEIRDTEKQREIWNTYLMHLQHEFDVDEIPAAEQHEEFTCPEIKLHKITKKK